jgi:putative tryptophan/tyrosine transport system substrate-binding protein
MPFFQRLGELGYKDKQTIAIDYLSADGHGEHFSDLAGQCLRLDPDIIVVTTTPAAQAAKSATRNIPIVMIPLGIRWRPDSSRASLGPGAMSPG